MGTGLSETKILKKPKNMKGMKGNLYGAFTEHIELVAALFSGLLILLTWSFKSHLSPTMWVVLHLAAFIIGGFAKAKEGITETIADKKLNVEMLMIFAAIGSAAIGFWTEGAILIFIFALAGALETYTLNKSDQEISALMNLQPEEARLLIDGIEKTVPVSELEIGDTIFVRASERIPADGKIIRGNTDIDETTITGIDESAITGESLPVSKGLDQEVFAGTVALDGSITIEITKPADETLFQKIIKMVQSAQDEKSPSQLFIERFEGAYVNIVLIAVFIMMFLPYLVFDWTLTDSIYRAMVLLVVASPCALVASIMPATLSAISNSARHGVLFKGGVHAENISHINAIAFDKTGTLTNGTPLVTDSFIHPDYDEDKILAIIGAIESESTHPLAEAITTYCKNNTALKLSDLIVDDMTTIGGKGVTAKIDQTDWKIGNAKLVGKEAASQFHNQIGSKLAEEGKSLTFIKQNDDIVGIMGLKDTVRSDTKDTIKQLQKRGIHTVMLTGDNEITAGAVAKETGLDEYIAECLPDEKVTEVKRLREKYGNVAMVGDGINDAPALASANVGMAMGEGTDVALETADVVLMRNDLSRINNTIALSRKMNRIVKQNIFLSLAVISVLIVSNFLQIIDLPLGVIGHEGSTILVILNGLRLLK